MLRDQQKFSSNRSLKATQKPRSQTDSAVMFAQVSYPEIREGPFIRYSVTGILGVIAQHTPKKPDSLNHPDLYVTLSRPVGAQEVIDRHPVDRSSERPSSRQQGTRSKTRSKRKGSGGAKGASTLSNVEMAPESPLQNQGPAPGPVGTEGCPEEQSPIHRSAFYDDNEVEDPVVPPTSSSSGGIGGTHQPSNVPPRILTRGLADHDFKDIDELFSGAGSDSDEGSPVSSAVEPPATRGAFSGQAAYPHTSLGSPSSPKHRRHLSEPMKLK